MANKSYINKYAKALFDTSEKNNSTLESRLAINVLSVFLILVAKVLTKASPSKEDSPPD